MVTDHYSPLLQPEGSHRPYINEWTRPCYNKTLFMVTRIWIAYHFHVLQNILVLIFSIPLIVQQYLMLGAIAFDEQAAASQAVVISYVFWAWLVGIVASIPIGPALTAMHFVLLKIVREEESYITKTFFKSFKED